jgi:hypothetical protein
MDNEDFIAWANETIVVCVAHGDKGHDPAEGVCPLYPGLTCEQHQQASMDMTNAPEGLPKIASPDGVPWGCLIKPDGSIHEFEKGDDRVSGKLMDVAAEVQKPFGDPLVMKKYEKIQEAFADADAAIEKGDWKAAIKAYAELEKGRKKAPAALTERLDAKEKDLDDRLDAAWTEIEGGSLDPAAKVKAANELLGKVKQTLGPRYVAVKVKIEAWLKVNKPSK